MLKTRSAFIYDLKIEANNNSISFQETAGPLRIGVLQAKTYTLKTLAEELSRVLNAVGDQTYLVTFNLQTRSLTITSTLNFSILISTGPFVGSTVWVRLGLGFIDLTGSNAYTGITIGKEYRPQFFLLDYVDGNNNQRAIDSTLNETSGGVVEVIRYGTKKIYEMNFDFITTERQENFIENDILAIERIRDFLENITQKNLLQFFPDRDDYTIAVDLILETTPESGNGVSFKLKEKPGLPDYFNTGLLTFREVIL